MVTLIGTRVDWKIIPAGKALFFTNMNADDDCVSPQDENCTLGYDEECKKGEEYDFKELFESKNWIGDGATSIGVVCGTQDELMILLAMRGLGAVCIGKTVTKELDKYASKGITSEFTQYGLRSWVRDLTTKEIMETLGMEALEAFVQYMESTYRKKKAKAKA